MPGVGTGIGMGIGTGFGAPRNAWWPSGASFAADFARGRYMRAGVAVSAAEAFSFSRASAACAQDSAGTYHMFGPDEPRITDRGLLLEPASTRLTTFPATPVHEDWATLGGATKAGHPGTFLGLFSGAATVGSGGFDWSGIQTAAFTVEAGTSYGITALYMAGTSGRCRVTVRNETAGQESHVQGAVGDLAISSQSGGIITDLAELQFGAVYVVTYRWTPDASGMARLRIIPASVTTDATLVAIGGWIESEASSSPILDNPGETIATRVADSLMLHLPPGPQTLKLIYEELPLHVFTDVGGEFLLPSSSAGKLRKVSASLS